MKLRMVSLMSVLGLWSGRGGGVAGSGDVDLADGLVDDPGGALPGPGDSHGLDVGLGRLDEGEEPIEGALRALATSVMNTCCATSCARCASPPSWRVAE